MDKGYVQYTSRAPLPLTESELSPDAIGDASSYGTPARPVYRSSVQLLLSHLDDLQVAVAEAHEQPVAQRVPGDRGHLVELVGLHLLRRLLLQVLLPLQLEAALAHHGRVLGLEVPDLPSDLSTDGDPVAPGVESEAVHGGASIVGGGGLLDVAEVEDADLLVLAAGDDEVAAGGDGDGVDGAVVDLDAVLDVEGLVVPDLEVAVPADGGEVLSAGGLGGGGDEAHLGDPVVVVVLLDGVLAVALHVPELDLAVGAGGEDVPAVAGDGAGEDLLGVAVLGEALGGLAGAEVPQAEGPVPGGGEEVVVVVGEGEVADEVRVAGELLHGLSEVGHALGLVVELPDEDGPVTGGSDQHLGVLVLLLGVSGLNGSHPVGVALQVPDFLGVDGALFSHHRIIFNIIKKINHFLNRMGSLPISKKEKDVMPHDRSFLSNQGLPQRQDHAVSIGV